MSNPVENLEPRAVWSHFDGIRRVPRPSKHEEKIVEHVRGWAGGHGFPVASDAAGNLVISVPATAGRESAPTVVLQGHLDMVCEKNEGVEHDFFSDPIRLRVDGDWVAAVGTTLGADNGLGVAAAMAAASEPEAVHGPLELLFTLDEETGLTGAAAFDGSLVSGRLLVNLDTEEDDAVYIGCAGSGGLVAEVPLERDGPAPNGVLRQLAVRGLVGGHSGMDIAKQRANAIKVMTRVLLALADDGLDLGLVALRGGSARNAIARECFADLRCDERRAGDLEAALGPLSERMARDYGFERELAIVLGEGSHGGAALAGASRDRLLRVLAAAPHGVLAMSSEVPGLVETSNNLALVETRDDRARIVCSFRSSSNPALAETRQSLASLFRLAGARLEDDAGYPGWPPAPDVRPWYARPWRRTKSSSRSLPRSRPCTRGSNAAS